MEPFSKVPVSIPVEQASETVLRSCGACRHVCCLGIPPGRHVSAGMEPAIGQGRPDSY